MEYKGINYDVGTRTLTGSLTRESFDPAIVASELEIIKNELHCNAVRITGPDIERIARASEMALQMPLTVWFSPYLHYEGPETTFKYIVQGAIAAEKLRSRYLNLIFVVGCELSIFTSGFVQGRTGSDRLKNLFSPISLMKNSLGVPRTYNKRLNRFLTRVVNEIKKHFHGPISYASGSWEKVDWNVFDIIGIDLYRSAFNKSTFLREIRSYKSLGKPLSIMEFGCCSYQGAEAKGALGWTIVDWGKSPPQLKGEYIRDEGVQSKTLLELLNIFEMEHIFSVFVYTFVTYNYVHNDDPRYDLDMASYGIVKALAIPRKGYRQKLPWMPKQAFFQLGAYYANR